MVGSLFLLSLFLQAFWSYAADPTPISASLDGNVDWSRSIPWVNLLHQARTFGSADSPWDGVCSIDSNGWPTQDFGVVLQSEGVTLEGTYLVQCTGKADISPTATSGSITNANYDAATNTQTANLIINSDAEQIMLSFRNTNKGVQNLVILQPGYTIDQKDDFTDLYLSLVSRFSTLRFMDWAQTNGSPVVNWADRTSPTNPSFADGTGVPWEQAIKLCNTVKRDMWINIPHQATDDYVDQLGKLIYTNLDPSLNVYFEYSNEVWNWQFSQATWSLNAAVDSVNNSGDPYYLDYDKCGNEYYWQWRRTALRAKQIGDQFAAIFGENERPFGRVRPVLAGQVVQIFVVQNGLWYIEAVYGKPNKYFYAIAGAPYFNLGDGGTIDGLTTQQVLEYLNTSVNNMAVSTGVGSDNYLAQHAAWSTWYGIKMLGYEGGPDTFGPTSIEAKKNASLDPQMEGIVVNYLNTWYNYGFDRLNWFVAGASDYDSQYGTWGVLENMHNFDVPKLRGIDDVRLGTHPPVTVGPEVPVIGYNATQWVGHPNPDKDPYLRYLGLNSTFLYIFRLSSPGSLKVTVSAQTLVSNPQLQIGLNNEQFQTITLNQASTFTAQPSVTFSNVPSGSNVVRLLVLTERGYEINVIDFQ